MQKTLEKMQNEMDICNEMMCSKELKIFISGTHHILTLENGTLSSNQDVSIKIEKDESLTSAINRLRKKS